MGKCISSKEANVEVSKPVKDTAKGNLGIASKSQTIFEQNLPEKFKDMPEIEDKYVGEGVRRMKAYKCDLKVDELQKLQDEFWSDRMAINKAQWKMIKQICIVDEGMKLLKSARARNLMKTNNLKVVKGCINLIQDNDGNMYKIPNFCINLPYFEREIAKVNDIENVNLISLHLFLYDLYGNKKYEINIENKKTGSEIKRMFCEIADIKEDEYKLKFIFGGTEIQDEHYLFQYKLENDYTIQVFKMKRDII